jgi:transposase
MGTGPRVLRPERDQLFWDMVDLDSQLPPDHLVRIIWAFVDGLALPELYDPIKARDDVAGRPTPDPKVYLVLWIYATVEGVGSARALARLCEHHAAYRWICGRVAVNYHSLSDFRTLAGAVLDRILSESVAVLMAEGLVSLEEVAVDGTKLAANAAKSSLRDEAGIVHFERAARARVERLKAEVEADPGAGERRRRAAGARAEAEIASRAQGARDKLAELQAEKARREETHKKQEAAKGAPKASTTDPEARLMKMPDQSFRLAYNLMVAAAPQQQIILAIEPTDRRSEAGLAQPMVEEVARRYGARPRRLLVDTRLATAREIVDLADHDDGPTLVYRPPPPERAEVKPASLAKRQRRRKAEPPALIEWRQRMASVAGKLVYARRKLIEPINGRLKNGNWRQLRLRGLAKVRAEALLHAVAYNICRGHTLRLAQAA